MYVRRKEGGWGWGAGGAACFTSTLPLPKVLLTNNLHFSVDRFPVVLCDILLVVCTAGCVLRYGAAHGVYRRGSRLIQLVFLQRVPRSEHSPSQGFHRHHTHYGLF